MYLKNRYCGYSSVLFFLNFPYPVFVHNIQILCEMYICIQYLYRLVLMTVKTPKIYEFIR